jgi:hypothetical protein
LPKDSAYESQPTDIPVELVAAAKADAKGK